MGGSDWLAGRKREKSETLATCSALAWSQVKQTLIGACYFTVSDRENNLLLNDIGIWVHIWFGPVAAIEIDSTAADALSATASA
jgi:hypothetical protein